jgi:hypothetical protein
MDRSKLMAMEHVPVRILVDAQGSRFAAPLRTRDGRTEQVTSKSWRSLVRRLNEQQDEPEHMPPPAVCPCLFI